MTELSPELELIGLDLRRAYASRLRRRRLTRTVAAIGAVAAVAAATATASAIGDLQIDPAKWFVTSVGSVDGGKGQYVHATNRQDGGPSTFMVEHDAGMDRYDAFLLHEKLVAEANRTSPVQERTEPGPLCTREQLATAEQNALDSLRGGGAADVGAVDQCRGLAYATEIAQRVYSGNEPAADLMPGVR